MLFKAALKETTVADSRTTPAAAEETPPHPYLLALGVLSIQKVCSQPILVLMIFSHLSPHTTQYLSAECKEESLTEFRETLENRARVRAQLIEDLKKKREPSKICKHPVYF